MHRHNSIRKCSGWFPILFQSCIVVEGTWKIYRTVSLLHIHVHMYTCAFLSGKKNSFHGYRVCTQHKYILYTHSDVDICIRIWICIGTTSTCLHIKEQASSAVFIHFTNKCALSSSDSEREIARETEDRKGKEIIEETEIVKLRTKKLPALSKKYLLSYHVKR